MNVVGNSITSERVLRNQLLADEGDPFNEILVNKSFNNIKSLGLFKNVETNIETSKQSMTKTINIEVEETSTGEFSLGGGYSSANGAQATIGLSENNFFGKGQRLKFLVLTSERQNSID